jgi:hypothetical protein
METQGWVIVSGPEHGEPDPATGLVVWWWHLQRGRHARHVRVRVSRALGAGGGAGLPADVGEAAATHGMSVVHEVAGWSEPPNTITLTPRGISLLGGRRAGGRRR